jgi:hypothetical protein
MWWQFIIEPGGEKNSCVTDTRVGHCTIIEQILLNPKSTSERTATVFAGVQSSSTNSHIPLCTLTRGVNDTVDLDIIVPVGASMTLFVEGDCAVLVKGQYINEADVHEVDEVQSEEKPKTEKHENCDEPERD